MGRKIIEPEIAVDQLQGDMEIIIPQSWCFNEILRQDRERVMEFTAQSVVNLDMGPLLMTVLVLLIKEAVEKFDLFGNDPEENLFFDNGFVFVVG